MKKIVILLLALLFIGACQNEEKPKIIVDYCTRFCILNNSGVQVAVVPKSYFSYIPDSLILQHGQTYSWGIFSGPFLLDKNTDPIRVYFNETTEVYYSGEIDHRVRDPRHSGYYIYQLQADGRGLSTYTFTVEDYQWALEQNKSLF